jgi:glycosyltransferase involved in cell wall biosynthesis
VTPSFNQGDFLEETLRSILLQGYPDIELFVMDGGSTDSSVETLGKYDRWITSWVSEPDAGQSAAINSGFAQASGQVLGWLNSDDFFLKDALCQVAVAYARDSRAAGWLGGAVEVDKASRRRRTRFANCDFAVERVLRWSDGCNWVQPSCFFSSTAFRDVGGLNESLHFVMDVDLWVKLSRWGHFVVIDDLLSATRMYPEIKSLRDVPMRQSEHIYLCVGYGYPAMAREILLLFAKKHSAFEVASGQDRALLDSCSYRVLLSYLAKRTVRGLRERLGF